MPRAVVVVVFVAVVSGCAPPLAVTATAEDEPAIWSGALGFMETVSPDARPFVISETSVAALQPYSREDLEFLLGDVDPATLDSLIEHADDVVPFEPAALPETFTSIAVADAPEPTINAPIVRVSRGGLGPDEALVYAEQVCGGLCGSGHIVLLYRGPDGSCSNFKVSSGNLL